MGANTYRVTYQEQGRRREDYQTPAGSNGITSFTSFTGLLLLSLVSTRFAHLDSFTVAGLLQNKTYDIRVQAGLDGVFAPTGAVVSFGTEVGLASTATTAVPTSGNEHDASTTGSTPAGGSGTAALPTAASTTAAATTTEDGLANNEGARGGSQDGVPIAAIIVPVVVVVSIVMLLIVLWQRGRGPVDKSGSGFSDPTTTQTFVNAVYLATREPEPSEYDTNMDSPVLQQRPLSSAGVPTQGLGRTDSKFSIDL